MDGTCLMSFSGSRAWMVTARWLALGCLLLLGSVALLPGQSVATSASSPADSLAEGRRLIGQKQFAAAAAVLEPLTQSHPAMGQGFMALGNARRGLSDTAGAIAAFQKAAAIPGTATPAGIALFGLYARAGQMDGAAEWLGKLRRTIDLTQVAITPGIEPLHNDPRFAELFPDRIAFDHPFVETDARIIHEWRGEAGGDEFGWIARGLGDVDGDHVTDVVISATQNPPLGSANGRLYVYSGKTGQLIWKQSGEPGALLGLGLESAGDINGDGVQDVAAGAPGMNAVLVFSGRDGRRLLILPGDSTDGDLGMTAAGVGDVNGDGVPDIAGGSPRSHASVGRVYLFSGRDGARLATLDGEHPGDGFGSTVGGANGRVIVGAQGGGEKRLGRVYLYDRLSATPAFIKDADETGIALGNMFVSVVGDVNGDGVPDIYASDFANTAKGQATGRVYIYSGKTGETLRTLTGESAGAGFGIGAARAGDVDGDGAADLVVGSWQYGAAAWSGGRVQVFSGKDGRTLQTITGRVPGETLGFDAVGVGDVNGDGRTDYLVTSAWSMVNGMRSGRVFIVAGTVGPGKR